MYTRFEDAKTIFGRAARFRPGPGSGLWARKSRKKIFRPSWHLRRWRGRWRCMYTRFEDEKAIFGPVARFCPVPGSAPARARILSKKRTSDRARAYGRMETGRRCMYSRFQHEQTTFEVSGGFAPAPCGALVRN
jgi:hypothetical protein